MYVLRKMCREGACAHMPELWRAASAETSENGKIRLGGNHCLVEQQDMGRVGAGNGNKAHALVESCRSLVLSAQSYAGEMVPGLIHQGRHQRCANAPVSPPSPHVDAPDTSHIRTTGKGVTVKAAHCDQHSLIQMATEGLSRSIKAIARVCPFLHQGLNEVVALINGIGL